MQGYVRYSCFCICSYLKSLLETQIFNFGHISTGHCIYVNMYVSTGGYFSKTKGMSGHKSLGHTVLQGRNLCAHLLNGYFLAPKRFGLPCSTQHTTHKPNRDNPHYTKYKHFEYCF